MIGQDERFMAQALALAARGLGTTSPNPPVGAVVVRHGQVVGVGHHQRAGGPHAEVMALRQAGPRARGGTLYVTLEPCCHLDKRTPPCVPRILGAGIRRVVVATRDPNPRVQGRGVAALRRAGLRVDVGIGRAEADCLIEPYRTRITTGRPFVTLKVAATLDGKIATARGESRWITGPASRKVVRHLRAQSDAVLVGIGTVLADNPSLTPSLPARSGRVTGHAPQRIVLDPSLKIPLRAEVVTDGKAPTLVVATSAAPPARRKVLERMGVEVLALPARRGRVSWGRLLRELGRRGVCSLLIEGGSEVNASALRNGVVDRVLFFLAPQLLGGQDAKGAIGGTSPARLAEAVTLKRVTVMHVGPDILVEGRLQSRSAT
jgi:diaminohydroxyphosphoribosylaminopyrimidine deaminase/5-amino-6-(5-phosphoribosylamino)uracil reductase